MISDSVKVLRLARQLFDAIKEHEHLSLAETQRVIEIAKWWAESTHPQFNKPIGIVPSLILFPVSREWLEYHEKAALQAQETVGEPLRG